MEAMELVRVPEVDPQEAELAANEAAAQASGDVADVPEADAMLGITISSPALEAPADTAAPSQQDADTATPDGEQNQHAN